MRQLTFEVVFPTIQANNNRSLDRQLKENGPGKQKRRR